MKMIIELTPQEAGNILKQYYEGKGRSVTSVSFVVNNITNHPMSDGYPKCTSVEVTIESDGR